MKLTFLGSGSAFTTSDYYQSNMLVTAASGKRLLIDCGGDARHALREHFGASNPAALAINAVYISHLHADHIGGLECLALKSFFSPGMVKPKLYCEENLLDELWRHSLRGGLEWVLENAMRLDDYFLLQPLSAQGGFSWEGIRFSLAPLPHIVTAARTIFSYGLILQDEGNAGPRVCITTDTRFEPSFLLPLYKQADILFQDCETGPTTNVHAHYSELRTLPDEIRRRMWLYHYQPHPRQQAIADGFLGFVSKGQEFDF